MLNYHQMKCAGCGHMDTSRNLNEGNKDLSKLLQKPQYACRHSLHVVGVAMQDPNSGAVVMNLNSVFATVNDEAPACSYHSEIYADVLSDNDA